MGLEFPHFIFYSFESAEKEFNAFLDVYYPIKQMIPPDVKITNLKPKAERICRFCLKSSPEVTFKKLAHIIPESLGNKHLVSDFECDTCNEKFSALETNFSSWLGAIKTLTGTKGKNGIPQFIPANETVKAKKVTFLNTPATKISTGDASTGTVSLNKETGEVIFKFKKDGYTPIKAYKSLLKIALSMINPNERQDYQRAFDFLLGPDELAHMQVFAKVICLELPVNHTITKPVGVLFQKMEPKSKFPLHYFTLYYEHFIYGFPIPFNQMDIDKGCYSGNHIDVLYAPPIMFWEPDKKDMFYSHTEDFSLAVKKSNEEQIISFNLSPDALNNLIAIDPKTGETKNGSISGEEIVSLLMVSENLTIPNGFKFDVP